MFVLFCFYTRFSDFGRKIRKLLRVFIIFYFFSKRELSQAEGDVSTEICLKQTMEPRAIYRELSRESISSRTQPVNLNPWFDFDSFALLLSNTLSSESLSMLRPVLGKNKQKQTQKQIKTKPNNFIKPA